MVRRTSAVAAVAAVGCAALIAVGAEAGTPAGQYVVQSLTLTYSTSTKTTGAIDHKGRSGTLKTTLTATLRGTSAGGPVTLYTPEVLSEYLCAPSCPGFQVSGTVKIVETFKPAGAKAVSCTSTKTLPKGTPIAQIGFSGSDTNKKVITADLINDALSVNSVYQAGRKATCPTPQNYPADSNDYSGFGKVSIPVGTMGSKSITVKFRNHLKTSTYPWPTTGSNAVSATVTLSRKS